LLSKIWDLDVGLIAHPIEADSAVRPQFVDLKALSKCIEV